ncbi:hypothetical protein BH11PLA1_BH11PLA1_03460 [soil metagenome]
MATVIVLDSGGRLGNKLIHFAAVYAWCLHRGHRLINPAFYAYAHHFPNLGSDLLLSGTHPLRAALPLRARLQKLALRAGRAADRRGWLRGVLNAHTAAECIRLPPTPTDFDDTRARRYWLQGWYFRNPVGLDIYRTRIVELLRPAPKYERDADEFARGLGDSTVNVAVHMRLGDYKTERASLYHGIEQYAAAMAAVRAAVAARSGRAVRFAVFSDEQVRVEDFAPWNLDVVASRGSVLEDLTRLSRFRGIIAPPSTFSQWAAYVGGGKVLEIGVHPDAALKYIESEPIARSAGELAEHLLTPGASPR